MHLLGLGGVNKATVAVSHRGWLMTGFVQYAQAAVVKENLWQLLFLIETTWQKQYLDPVENKSIHTLFFPIFRGIESPLTS